MAAVALPRRAVGQQRRAVDRTRGGGVGSHDRERAGPLPVAEAVRGADIVTTVTADKALATIVTPEMVEDYVSAVLWDLLDAAGDRARGVEVHDRVAGQDTAIFQSADLTDLLRKVGSEAIAKQCAAAERALEVVRRLQALPDVDYTYTAIGETGTVFRPVNEGTIYVKLKTREGKTFSQVLREARAQVHLQRADHVGPVPAGPGLAAVLVGPGREGQAANLLCAGRRGQVADHDHHDRTGQEDQHAVVLEVDVVHDPEERS